jgi:hypothetical protein
VPGQLSASASFSAASASRPADWVRVGEGEQVLALWLRRHRLHLGGGLLALAAGGVHPRLERAPAGSRPPAPVRAGRRRRLV